MNKLSLLSLSSLSFLLPLAARAQTYGNGPMMGNGYNGGYGRGWHMAGYGGGLLGLGLLGFVLYLIFWVLIITGIVYFIKYLAYGSHGCHGKHCHEYKSSGEAEKSAKESGSAIEILKHRYAKGEINKEEFDRMKKDLLEM